jgi:hypothetical protein
MTGRKFEDISAAQIRELKEILESYAIHCEEMARQLGDKPLRTDGYTTVKKGLFALKNLIGRQLGQMAVAKPEVVHSWVFRTKPNSKHKPSQQKHAAGAAVNREEKVAESAQSFDLAKEEQVSEPTAKSTKKKRPNRNG